MALVLGVTSGVEVGVSSNGTNANFRAGRGGGIGVIKGRGGVLGGLGICVVAFTGDNGDEECGVRDGCGEVEGVEVCSGQE